MPASPYINRYAVLNDVGQQIGGGNGGSLTGFQSIYNNALGLGESNLQGRAGGLVDMRTGQLLRQPQSAAEAALAQQQLEQYAANQSNAMYNQALGLLGGGSGSTGAGAAASDPAFDRIKGMFGDRLSAMLTNPGLDDATIENIISKGTEGITESESSSRRQLAQMAGASGFAEGGAREAGAQKMMSDYSGQRANLDRDVRIEAAKNKQDMSLGALNSAGNYLGRAEDNARSDRNKLLEIMLGRQISTPDLSGLIGTAGMGAGQTSMGFGGGANASTSTYGGTASGSNNSLPGFQPTAGGATTTIVNKMPDPPPPGGGGGGGGDAAGNRDADPLQLDKAPKATQPTQPTQPTQQTTPTPNYGLQQTRSLPPTQTGSSPAPTYLNPATPLYMQANPGKQQYNPRNTGQNPFTAMTTFGGATPKKKPGESDGGGGGILMH